MNIITRKKILYLSILLLTLSLLFSVNSLSANDSHDAYLMTYFKSNNSQPYMAYSTDALQWTTLNNGQPVVTSTIGSQQIRDPFVIRGEDNMFHLLGTDNWSSTSIVIYDSTDLVNWTNQRLVQIAPSTSNFAWAPEAFYDASINQYRIIFAAQDSGGIHKMYQVTTSDFVNVSSPTTYYNPGTDRYAIDGTVLSSNGTNYMFFKYSDPGPSGKGIQRVQSSNLSGSWSNLSGPLTDLDVEGPTLIKLIGQNKWYMYYDYYIDGYFGISETTNLGGSWTQLSNSQFSLPAQVRHASIMTITQQELNTLTGGSSPVVSGNTYNLVNVASGKALDVWNMGTANGTNVAIYTLNNNAAQKWTIHRNSDGTYKLINPNSSKALDVNGFGTSNRTNVHIWQDYNNAAQKWSITQNSDGSYRLINPNSNKALDAAGTSNGSNVLIWDYWGGSNQHWNIVPAN